MSKNDTRMADIFDAFAAELINRLKVGEDVIDKSGEVRKINCSSSTLKVIKDFLTENDITCAPTKDNALGQLASQALPFPTKVY